ncbi:hypothetical protein NEHOM01_0309 [Nematocida homosporus]|uniref:uncharacterized protein n=1 Tax=Nematocida homosporus TaxID=1912981 RepID=UPI0022206700|nr:uncharacterized protein NEHOM01_0309 [Nematocida homosporus]KAI5184634.1 hypothetical protein NEHOM01_0309 [Nematocida homosporus]
MQIDYLVELLNTSLTKISPADHRLVLASILSYLLSFLSPHLSNCLYIREILHLIFGLLILGILYNTLNLSLIVLSVVVNLFLCYLPLKEKDSRVKVVVALNLILMLIAYLVYDTNDNNLFLTLSVLFMKYVYLALEYLPQSMGVMRYFGYIFFIPGMRYGPVLSYAAYSKWQDLGYTTLTAQIPKEKIDAEVGQETDAKRIATIKEHLAIKEYYRLVALGLAKFGVGLTWLVVYPVIYQQVVAAASKTNGLWAVPMIELLGVVGQLSLLAKWYLEEASYLTHFITDMSNTKPKELILSGSFAEMCAAWNIQGSKFMHVLGRVLFTTKSSSTNSFFDEYLRTSLLAYGHVLLFPQSLGALVLATLSIFMLACGIDSITAQFGLDGYLATIINLIFARVFFSYFMIVPFYPPSLVMYLWSLSKYYGQFICLCGMSRRVSASLNAPAPPQDDSDLPATPADLSGRHRPHKSTPTPTSQ